MAPVSGKPPSLPPAKGPGAGTSKPPSLPTNPAARPETPEPSFPVIPQSGSSRPFAIVR